MKWRVMVELTESDGTVRSHEMSTGGRNTSECSAGTVGLTLADGETDTRVSRTTLFGHGRRAHPRAVLSNRPSV